MINKCISLPNETEQYIPEIHFRHNALIPDDKKIIEELLAHFTHSNIINEFTSNEKLESNESLSSILEETNKAARSEKDFNKGYYDRELDKYLTATNDRKDHLENPILSNYWN